MGNQNSLILNARKLRNGPTDAESKLWSCLRRGQLSGLKFRRQAVIERFIVDFVCYERKVIIELDGSQHTEEAGKVNDLKRDELLRSCGFKVLRFWNTDIMRNTNGVLEQIHRECF